MHGLVRWRRGLASEVDDEEPDGPQEGHLSGDEAPARPVVVIDGQLVEILRLIIAISAVSSDGAILAVILADREQGIPGVIRMLVLLDRQRGERHRACRGRPLAVVHGRVLPGRTRSRVDQGGLCGAGVRGQGERHEHGGRLHWYATTSPRPATRMSRPPHTRGGCSTGPVTVTRHRSAPVPASTQRTTPPTSTTRTPSASGAGPATETRLSSTLFADAGEPSGTRTKRPSRVRTKSVSRAMAGAP